MGAKNAGESRMDIKPIVAFLARVAESWLYTLFFLSIIAILGTSLINRELADSPALLLGIVLVAIPIAVYFRRDAYPDQNDI